MLNKVSHGYKEIKFITKTNNNIDNLYNLKIYVEECTIKFEKNLLFEKILQVL